MEPGHEDREDEPVHLRCLPGATAAMEPGHEDREDVTGYDQLHILQEPQWSPVMKTGKTTDLPSPSPPVKMPQWSPVMKPGKTAKRVVRRTLRDDAAMEPGHEDREDTVGPGSHGRRRCRRNGARS